MLITQYARMTQCTTVLRGDAQLVLWYSSFRPPASVRDPACIWDRISRDDVKRLQRKYGKLFRYSKQGCKRDLFFRDRDETETFESLIEARPRRDFNFPRDETETFHFGFEARPRPRPSFPRLRRFSRCHKRHTLSILWLQTAINYAVIRSFIIQTTV